MDTSLMGTSRTRGIRAGYTWGWDRDETAEKAWHDTDAAQEIAEIHENTHRKQGTQLRVRNRAATQARAGGRRGWLGGAGAEGDTYVAFQESGRLQKGLTLAVLARDFDTKFDYVEPVDDGDARCATGRQGRVPPADMDEGWTATGRVAATASGRCILEGTVAGHSPIRVHLPVDSGRRSK